MLKVLTFKCLRVDADSLDAIQLLEDGCSQQHPCNKLVEEDIGDVVGCIAQETWNSAFRDASCVADAMGKQALSINMDYHVFELASDCISMLWELI